MNVQDFPKWVMNNQNSTLACETLPTLFVANRGLGGNPRAFRLESLEGENIPKHSNPRSFGSTQSHPVLDGVFHASTQMAITATVPEAVDNSCIFQSA